MFTYALLKGIRLGYIDRTTYFDTAQKAYQSIVKTFVVQESDGTLGWTGTVSVSQTLLRYLWFSFIFIRLGVSAGMVTTRFVLPSSGIRRADLTMDSQYYISVALAKNDLKGVSPFIMASLEFEKA